jgi:hypothetical protein
MWSSIAALLYFAAAKGDASGNLRLQPLIPLWLISSSWASMYSSVWGRRRRSLSRVPQAGFKCHERGKKIITVAVKYITLSAAFRGVIVFVIWHSLSKFW